MSAEARPAGGGGKDSPGLDEDFGQPLAHSLEVNVLGARKDDAAHALGDLASLEDGRGGAQILDASVRAGAYDALIDFDFAHIIDGAGVLGEMRERDGRTERREIDGDGADIFRIRIGGINDGGAQEAVLAVGLRHLVHREDAVLRAGLNSHVGDAQAVVHGQGLDALARKFERLVERAVHADLADQVEDHILAADPFGGLAYEFHLDSGGDFEPRLACDHAGGHVGGADARGERAERAVSTGVGIGADHAVAGADDAFLRKKRVLNAHLAHVVEMGDVIFFREPAHLKALLRGLDVLIGGEVVEHQSDAVLIKDGVRAAFFKFVDGDGAGNIVAEHDIEVRLNQLSHLHVVQTGVRRQNFLGHSHSHKEKPP